MQSDFYVLCDRLGAGSHLWLRYLPASFIDRMACVCMRWADAAMPLRMWREEMEELRQAFAQFGVPDERLLVPPLTAERRSVGLGRAGTRFALGTTCPRGWVWRRLIEEWRERPPRREGQC